MTQRQTNWNLDSFRIHKIQSQSIYPIYSIETPILKGWKTGGDRWMEPSKASEKLKGRISKVLVRAKNGNWKFPFQLPGLSS